MKDILKLSEEVIFLGLTFYLKIVYNMYYIVNINYKKILNFICSFVIIYHIKNKTIFYTIYINPNIKLLIINKMLYIEINKY